jgi:UDP-glucose 4-epimerase
MDKNVLITGAAGFVGTELVKAFISDSRITKIIGTDIRDKHSLENTDKFQYQVLDIRDPSFSDVLSQNSIDTVIHLASIVTPTKKMTREFVHSVDVGGTQNILESCLKAGVQHFIYTSSGAAYGYYKDNPEWIDENDEIRGNQEFAYSDHKRIIEELCAEYRVKHPSLKQLILRPGTLLGPHVDNQITDLFKKPLIFGIQGAKTPFVFMWDKDVVDIIILGTIEAKEGIFNLAGDGAMTLREIAGELKKPYLALPYFVVFAALSLLKLLKLSQYGPEQVDFLRYRPVLSNKRLKNDFGFTPSKSSKEAFLCYVKQNQSFSSQG